jgi:hypothetical protein
MFCWGGSPEKPHCQKDLSLEDLSRGGEVTMRFLRTILRPCNHAYRFVTYRIGDMRAVMIEGPSREANEPIELGSCADVNQLANTFGT